MLLVGISACGNADANSAGGQQNANNGNVSAEQESSNTSNGGNAVQQAKADAGSFAGVWSFVSLKPADGASASKAAELECALKSEQSSGGYVKLIITNDTSHSYETQDGEDASQLPLAYRRASDGADAATEVGGITLSEGRHARYQELWDGINFANDYFNSTLELSADGQTLMETSGEYTVTYQRAGEDTGPVDKTSPENSQAQQIDAGKAHVKLGKGETAWKLDRLEFVMPAGSEELRWPDAFFFGSKSYDVQVYARKEVATTSTRLSAQTAVENEWADYQSRMGGIPGRGQSVIEHLTVSGYDAIRFTRDGASNGGLKVFVHAMVLVVDVDGCRYVLESDLPDATDAMAEDPKLDETLARVVGSATIV